MGKIVKFCAACDESFAEKFSFCPNCGQAMSAFEMNPLNAAETKISEAPVVNVENEKAVEPEVVSSEMNSDVPISAPVSADASSSFEMPESAKTREFFTVHPIQPSVAAKTESEVAAIEEPAIEDSVIENEIKPETKTFAAAVGTNGNGNYQKPENNFQSNFIVSDKSIDDGYHITVIEEKNVNQRNGLLLATMVLMITVVLGATIFSLFNRDFLVGAINQDDPLYVAMVEDVPMEVEEQPKPKTDKDAGGGGGGGKEEPEPASKGRLVSQSENPITPPSVNIPQLKNPSLPVIMETKGNIKRPITEERPGLPGSDNLNPSNGNGRGGGIGGGNGTGIGGGNGTGEGNGNGSGSGNGDGNGNGNGRGDGTQGFRQPPPPPQPPVGVTEAVKIISKPRANYTDAARQNQVTGTVILRVTFLPSGQIGSVSPVNGLPYGLTEQAIAAAKGIRFEPAKKNGVPYSVTKQVQYSFTIY